MKAADSDLHVILSICQTQGQEYGIVYYFLLKGEKIAVLVIANLRKVCRDKMH
jgi:hypothetical protein